MRPPSTDRPEGRVERAEPRDLAALTALAAAHPELAPAVALERELLDGERRLQRRLGTAWLALSDEELAARLGAGRRLIDWEQLSFDWPELRLRLRQVIDVLRRHDIIDAADAGRLQDLGRDQSLPDVVRRWFLDEPFPPTASPALGDVLGIAVRPFLARAVEVVQQRVSTDVWQRGTCPMCGGRPGFGVLTGTGQRHLVCSRCHGRWALDTKTCPYCLSSDRIRVFSALEGQYQVAACDGCRHYVKALDARRAGRSLSVPLDTVATLALDQAIAAQGYSNE